MKIKKLCHLMLVKSISYIKGLLNDVLLVLIDETGPLMKQEKSSAKLRFMHCINAIFDNYAIPRCSYFNPSYIYSS